MTSALRRSAEGALVALALAAAGLAAAPASAQVRLGPEVVDLTQGLFCAPPDGGRRAAPGTLSGWIHVPDEPVRMVAEGSVAPAVLGMGFGVRFLRQGATVGLRFVVTHPPMGPGGATRQTWDSLSVPGAEDAIFFQFDVPEELVTGAWAFQAFAGGAELFHAPFRVVDPSSVPELVALCQPGGFVSRLRTEPPWGGN